MLDDDTVIYAAGISYKIHNVKTGIVKLFFSINGGGIGSIAVDPSRKYYAVAEKGSFPCIYIHEFPSLRCYRVLRYGTEKSYSHISFSVNGERLASVGSKPDYNICIWDWKNEILVLKAKAFSQEVFRVIFSDHSNSILSTSGLAHLRFWKIANTFTGLKLKGQTGKFGSVQLSDITGFYIFPDGKVITGSENGRLLLWEGNLIKAVLSINESQPCHTGVINTVTKVDNYIVSAGEDGMLRYWDFREIDEMEPNEQMEGFINIVKEHMIVTNPNDPPQDHRPALILEIVIYPKYWLIHDALGKVFKVTFSGIAIHQQEILHFNSGKIMGICSSKEGNAVATIGQDGAIRLLDFVNRKEYYSRAFKGKGTCIDWLNVSFNKTDRFIAAGFDNGIVRIVHLSKDKIHLLKAMKVHNNPIKSLSLSPNGETLAVLSSEGEIFFLHVEPDRRQGGLKIENICIHPTQKVINYMTWGERLNRLLVSTNKGEVIEMEVPSLQDFNSSETYLNENVKKRTYTICMMEFQKPKIDEKDLNFLMMEDNAEQQEVEWDPASISSVIYMDEEQGKFLCSAEGQYAGYLYICQFGERRPLQAIPCSKDNTRYFGMPRDSDLLISGTETGEVYVRPLNNLEFYSVLKNHDQNTGRVVGALLNPSLSAIITASEDATIMTKAIDLQYFKEVSKLRLQQKQDRENKRQRKLKNLDEDEPDEKEGEGEEEQEESDDDDEEKQYKTDSYDITIMNMSVKPPDLVDGISPDFFEHDLPDRQDAQDIIDDTIYSIQEEKLLAEEDKRKREAEQVKYEMRENIRILRESYEAIKKSDADLDSFLKLEFKDFNIDDEYLRMLQSRVADMLDEANKEVQWSIEYHKMKSKKLKDFYLSELEFDRFAVKSFTKPIAVTTMRVKIPSEITRNKWIDIEPSKIVEEKKEDLVKAVVDEKYKDLMRGEKNLIDEWEEKKNKEPIVKDANFLKNKKEQIRKDQQKNSVEKFTRAKMKADKEIRSRMKQELIPRKPTGKSAVDNEEIRKAEAKMGNYVLKSDPNYEVPNNESMSLFKQNKLIYLWEEFIHGSKRDFNLDLTKKRDWKKSIFDKITAANTRITEIDAQLDKLADISDEKREARKMLMVPEYDEFIEFPEKLLEVTKEEVEALAKEKEEEKLRKKLGRFGGGNENPQEGDGSPGDDQAQEAATEKQTWAELQYKERKNIKVQESVLEREVKAIKKLRLNTERDLLIKDIETDIKDFDEQLEHLAEKKLMLEYEMKFLQSKLVTTYQELIILEAFDKKDDHLRDEYEKQKKKDYENTELMNQNTVRMTEKNDNHKSLELRLKEADGKFFEKMQSSVSKEVAQKAFEYYRNTEKRTKPADGDNDDVENQLDEEDDDVAPSDADARKRRQRNPRFGEELATRVPEQLSCQGKA
jgi:WD40 repeat protein